MKVVTYNILGPIQAQSEKHDYASIELRDWFHRRDELFTEFVSLNADIFCLQEVSQRALIDTFIPSKLRSINYC